MGPYGFAHGERYVIRFNSVLIEVFVIGAYHTLSGENWIVFQIEQGTLHFRRSEEVTPQQHKSMLELKASKF